MSGSWGRRVRVILRGGGVRSGSMSGSVLSSRLVGWLRSAAEDPTARAVAGG